MTRDFQTIISAVEIDNHAHDRYIMFNQPSNRFKMKTGTDKIISLEPINIMINMWSGDLYTILSS